MARKSKIKRVKNRGQNLYFFCNPPLSKTGVIITPKNVLEWLWVAVVEVFNVSTIKGGEIDKKNKV